MSRNEEKCKIEKENEVAPREGCVSRNVYKLSLELPPLELHPVRGV